MVFIPHAWVCQTPWIRNKNFLAPRNPQSRQHPRSGRLQRQAFPHLHALHEACEAPEGFRLVPHDVQDGRRQVRHALRRPQFLPLHQVAPNSSQGV